MLRAVLSRTPDGGLETMLEPLIPLLDATLLTNAPGEPRVDSAQISGLEWNVRVSGARNPDVIDKVAAVFESSWNSGDFVPYDAVIFAAATAGSLRER